MNNALEPFLSHKNRTSLVKSILNSKRNFPFKNNLLICAQNSRTYMKLLMSKCLKWLRMLAAHDQDPSHHRGHFKYLNVQFY